MKKIILLIVLASCSKKNVITSQTQSKADERERIPPKIKRKPHTFDILTQIVEPGKLVKWSVTLPKGWSVTGAPPKVSSNDSKNFLVSPPNFGKSPDGQLTYEVSVLNAGNVAARYIADVECVGCP